MRNHVASRSSAGGATRERVADVAEVADRRHPHEDESAHTGNDELVHAVGSLVETSR